VLKLIPCTYYIYIIVCSPQEQSACSGGLTLQGTGTPGGARGITRQSPGN
jgi:hypothetical protein